MRRIIGTQNEEWVSEWLAWLVANIGGAEGDRTPDLMTASSNQAISSKQISKRVAASEDFYEFPVLSGSIRCRTDCLLPHPATIWPQPTAPMNCLRSFISVSRIPVLLLAEQ